MGLGCIFWVWSFFNFFKGLGLFFWLGVKVFLIWFRVWVESFRIGLKFLGFGRGFTVWGFEIWLRVLGVRARG